MQRPKKKTLTPAAAAANNICLSQTPGGTGALVLNGAAVAGGKATLDMPRRVLITNAGNDSARSFTITGTADGEKVISEVLKGTNTATATSLKDYLTVTSIVVDAACAAALTFGTNATAGGGLVCMSSPWIPILRESWEVGFDVILAAGSTINYTVEFTLDYIDNPVNPVDTYFNPFPHSVVAAKTANAADSFVFVISAIRVTINSYTVGASIDFHVRAASA